MSKHVRIEFLDNEISNFNNVDDYLVHPSGIIKIIQNEDSEFEKVTFINKPFLKIVSENIKGE